MERSKILIVDDNPEIREIIEILLTGEGFETVQAKDGITALRLLEEQDFDLIILLLPLSFYQNCLIENADFIRLAGFSCGIELSPENSINPLSFLGDETMLKRIFNNLFSNILKYGDKSQAVLIRLTVDGSELKLLLKNRTKEEINGIESNHIGLKSVEKMMSLLGGRMLFCEKEQEFAVQLTFPAS